MDLQQLYTDLILEYNRDMTNKRKIESPTIHEHGHNPSCGDDIEIEVKVDKGVILPTREAAVQSVRPPHQ